MKYKHNNEIKVKPIKKSNAKPEVYSGPCQTSKIELFAKLVHT